MPFDWFSIYAPFYNRFVSLMGIAPVAPLLEMIDLHADDRVLDVGGGTGRIAAAVAGVCQQVVVVDPCRAMLKRAPHLANMHRVRGHAPKLPFADASFDLVLCVDALHHIKAIEAAAAEIRRVLRPSGRLFVQDFDIRSWRGKWMSTFEHWFVDDSKFVDPPTLQGIFAGVGIEGITQRRSWLEFSFAGRKVGM
jgi:ubiquinone/menaquinone biosynthesis C-methylase UbiE